MFKISVINLINGRSFGGQFDTMDEINAYVARCEAKAQQGLGWGYSARSILKSECPETHLGLVLSEETRIDEITGEELVYVNLDKEYEITIQDLAQDAEWLLQECYRKRKAEYPAVEELWNVFCDKGPQSQDWVDLMAYRASVKNKYPKE